jgi:transketolase
MRVLPNMTILECGDATDVESVLDVAQAVDGPVYVRMLRGEVPRLFPREEPMRFGHARVLSEGDDVAVLSSGICTEEVMRATQALRDRGVSLQHLHVSTLKPFDDPVLMEAIQPARLGVITMENHTIIGGLGSAVAELIAEAGLPKRLVRLGINDQYAHGASRAYLMKKYGLDAGALVRAVEALCGESLGVADEDLRAVELAPAEPEAKAEDL